MGIRMKKTGYELIALDMDGTLLDSGHRITPRGEAAVKEILRRGGHVVFATGRCLGEMEEYLSLFPGMRYLICESGACVYDLAEKKDLFRMPLTPDGVERVMAVTEKEDILASFFIGNRSFVDLEGCGRRKEFGLGDFERGFDTNVVRVEGLYGFYRENPMEVEKINLFFRDDGTRSRVCARLAGQAFSLASSIAGNLEINAAGVNKGEALRLLCGQLAIPMAHVISVGDSSNDKELLSLAGLGIAMGNAVPSLLPFADKKTMDCDHDGAAAVMEEYMLGV